jgi:predicted nucleic acid-binding protein
MLALVRDRCRHVSDISVATHEAAVALARDHRLSFHDALIVAAAQEAGCDTLYSEDMQHGRTLGRLRVVNPFMEGGG